MNNILISGIKGFIGTNLSAYLEEFNYSISGLSRSEDQNKRSFTWKNISAIKEHEFKTYVHLAGKAHDLKNTCNPQEYFNINTELTKTLFNSFLQSTAKDFIYFSSVKAVADTVDGILYEDVVPKPGTLYGQSKRDAEEYLLAQDLPQDKRLFILRPCMIHGPGNKGNLNLLYKFVQKGIPYPLAAFHNERSFLSISNLNFIIQRLICDWFIPGGIYNLADDEPLSTNEVIKLISQTLNRSPQFLLLPKSWLKIIAQIGDILNMPLNSQRLKKLTESYVVSNEKIKIALDINNLPVSSQEGLITTIQSFSSIK
jgi:nucleoside-diphosphate-sugar epimerase